MTQEEISRLAYQYEPLPEDANHQDRMLYSYLSVLYRLSRTGAIDTTKGKELKDEFLKSWEYLEIRMNTLTKIAEHDANKWLRLEPLNQKYQELFTKYTTDKNAENAENAINAAEEFRKEVYVG